LNKVLYLEVRYNTLMYDVTPVSIQVQVLRPLSDFRKNENYAFALTHETRKPKKAKTASVKAKTVKGTRIYCNSQACCQNDIL
jgi:hypothetical protein